MRTVCTESFRRLLACLAIGALAACATPPQGLAGSRWQLVEFQSMSDEIGTLRPLVAEDFTLSLNADGTASMRLDCNRANGTWSFEPGADGLSGSFTFGRLAATKALCPPPRLDEKILRDATFVRSYLLRDGRLYLALMADGGIYAWEPAEEQGETAEAR
jgi:heat shock protein HslJ